MQQYPLVADDSAISSVVSTLLLIGVAVVLATVTATFAFGVGQSVQDDPPQASFSVEEEKEEFKGGSAATADFTVVIISHDGGDTLDHGQLMATVNGEQAWTSRHTGGDTFGSWERPLFEPNGTFGAGEQIKIAHKDDDRLDESYDVGDGYDVDRDDTAVEDGPVLGPRNTEDANLQLEAGDELRLVWSSPTSDTRTVLVDHEVKMAN